jgi:hypothetical protein
VITVTYADVGREVGSGKWGGGGDGERERGRKRAKKKSTSDPYRGRTCDLGVISTTL